MILGETRSQFALTLMLLALFWAKAIVHWFTEFDFALAAIYSVMLLIKWWHPWWPPVAAWADRRMPSTDPSDYR